jgi:hypothetical protein
MRENICNFNRYFFGAFGVVFSHRRASSPEQSGVWASSVSVLPMYSFCISPGWLCTRECKAIVMYVVCYTCCPKSIGL